MAGRLHGPTQQASSDAVSKVLSFTAPRIIMSMPTKATRAVATSIERPSPKPAMRIAYAKVSTPPPREVCTSVIMLCRTPPIVKGDTVLSTSDLGGRAKAATAPFALRS
mmetsp:Transcript_103121/g.291608  ORF Transcript_103121/g.291608 Transcript_103121/m.291608 type:complete len:109 (+) Transcript_103121:1167-1493(+)